MTLLCIQKAKSFLQIHSSMARDCKKLGYYWWHHRLNVVIFIHFDTRPHTLCFSDWFCAMRISRRLFLSEIEYIAKYDPEKQHLLSDCLLMRESIRFDNVETQWIFMYSNGTHFNQMSFCQVRAFLQYFFSLWLTGSHISNFSWLITEHIISSWNGDVNMWSSGQFETSTLIKQSLPSLAVSADRWGDVWFAVHFSSHII